MNDQKKLQTDQEVVESLFGESAVDLGVDLYFDGDGNRADSEKRECQSCNDDDNDYEDGEECPVCFRVRKNYEPVCGDCFEYVGDCYCRVG